MGVIKLHCTLVEPIAIFTRFGNWANATTRQRSPCTLTMSPDASAMPRMELCTIEELPEWSASIRVKLHMLSCPRRPFSLGSTYWLPFCAPSPAGNRSNGIFEVSSCAALKAPGRSRTSTAAFIFGGLTFDALLSRSFCSGGIEDARTEPSSGSLLALASLLRASRIISLEGGSPFAFSALLAAGAVASGVGASPLGAAAAGSTAASTASVEPGAAVAVTAAGAAAADEVLDGGGFSVSMAASGSKDCN